MLQSVHICWGVGVWPLVVLDGIVRAQGNSQVCFFEQVGDVSLPMYVKDVHLCVVVLVSLTGVVEVRLWVGGLCMWTGKPLLDRMSWMVSSSLYSFSLSWYVFSLLYSNLTAAYLCWAGWLEEYGMTVSVKVGFLCVEVTQLVGVLWIVMSR